MRNRVFMIALVVVSVIALALPAAAVKYGEPDTGPEQYPSIGMLVFTDGVTGYWLCSGSLIDDDSVLTAGHCTDGAIAAWVNFDQAPIPYFAGAVPATDWVTHPGYDTGFPNTHDVGVVNFAPGTFSGMTPMPIAGAQTLDDLATARGKKNTTFEMAGYGVQATNGIPPSNPVQPDNDVFLQERYRGEVRLINLNSANNGGFNVQVTAAPGTGGALCFGDSGGPILHDGEIVAVNSFVLNYECAGSGFAYRVDRQDILDFIADNS